MLIHDARLTHLLQTKNIRIMYVDTFTTLPLGTVHACVIECNFCCPFYGAIFFWSIWMNERKSYECPCRWRNMYSELFRTHLLVHMHQPRRKSQQTLNIVSVSQLRHSNMLIQHLLILLDHAWDPSCLKHIWSSWLMSEDVDVQIFIPTSSNIAYSWIDNVGWC